MKKFAFDKKIQNEVVILPHINRNKIDEKIFFKKYFSILKEKNKDIEKNNLNQEIEKIKNKNSKYYKLKDQDMQDLQRIFSIKIKSLFRKSNKYWQRKNIGPKTKN